MISPFTSFIAVEEREKNEAVEKTVNIEKIVSAIQLDSLPYMAWIDAKQV